MSLEIDTLEASTTDLQKKRDGTMRRDRTRQCRQIGWRPAREAASSHLIVHTCNQQRLTIPGPQTWNIFIATVTAAGRARATMPTAIIDSPKPRLIRLIQNKYQPFHVRGCDLQHFSRRIAFSSSLPSVSFLSSKRRTPQRFLITL